MNKIKLFNKLTVLSRRHCLYEVKQTKSNLHFKTNDLVRGRSKVNIYLLTEFISVEVGRHLEVAGSQVLGHPWPRYHVPFTSSPSCKAL